jgi:deoxyribonuclease-4
MISGAHVSAAGGLWTAFDRAEEVGCETMQIFTKNKGAWNAKPLDDETVRAFKKRARETKIRPIVAHSSYLINLASPDRALRNRSTEALVVEVERCEMLGIAYLVLHPGAHKGEGEAAGLKRVTGSLNTVLRKTKGFRTKILLENSAGQGSSVCSGFASLARLMRDSLAPERLGICLDTCHLFAAGYELRTPAGYAATIDAFSEELDLREVLCFHVNDSKGELGSHLDRHEHIGEGQLGLGAFRLLVNDRRFAKAPMIFELSPENDMLRVNLKKLRRLEKKK